MRKPSMQLSVASAVFGAALLGANPVFAADTHVITVEGFAWVYKGKKSTTATPIAVDDLKKGDIIEVKIDDSGIPHGLVTIVRNPGTPPPPPVVQKKFVQACGETNDDAVLRETECGATSKFGVAFTGSLKMEVKNNFKDPVDFFCVVHKAGMPGQFKLAP
jgi:hypothetical protein